MSTPRPRRFFRLRAVAAALATLLLLGLLAAAIFVLWPVDEEIFARRQVYSLLVTDRRGNALREILSDEESSCRRLSGPLPERVVAAFLAAEDRRFFLHAGVDGAAVLRALGQNISAGRVVSGASTITQQLVRRLRPRRGGLLGKLEEMLWALRLERSFSKERLLREFLDRVPLGNSVFGVEAAAEFYFSRPARSLSWAQAALLAGMACSPGRYDPYRHPQAARARLGRVLDGMRKLGWLGEKQVRVEKEAPLDLVAAERAFRAPHLTEWLRRHRAELALGGASEVRTTLELSLQRDVEAILREELAALEKKRAHQAAALVVDNSSGEVLAYVGSRDFLDEEHLGQNDGVRALRQPGSALKPFAYALALSQGFTPASLLSDVEVHLSTPSGDYVPRNYDRRVHGPVRLRAALANSYNVPAVRLADALGPERVLEVLRAAGFDSLRRGVGHYGVGVVLGNGEVSLWELARAYRGLARGGVLEPLRLVREARAPDGQEINVPEEKVPRRFLPPEAVALLTDILADGQARAPAFGSANALRLPFAAAVKTGTSRGFVDNWTVGFSAERTVAVWVGNFDGASMRRVSGISGAGPIWARVMLRAMRGLTPRPLVDRSRFEHRLVCPLSGKLAGPDCPSGLEEIFIPGTAPRERCPMHLPGGRLDIGPEFYAWARAEGLQAGPPPTNSSAVQTSAPPAGVRPDRAGRLLMPGDGDRYLLEADIPLRDQTIPLRALPPPGVDRLEVRTSGGEHIILEAPYVSRLSAARGRHRLELWDPRRGELLDTVSYEVR